MAWPSLPISIKLGLITHYLKFRNNILNYKLTGEGFKSTARLRQLWYH